MRSAIQDRAAGAILGAFIGDALGMGVHWYYDLDEMHKDHGDWVSDYTDPKPGRYHDQLKRGDFTQAGYILKMTVKSLIEERGYKEGPFCKKMDDELLAKMDGTPISGPGGYTSQSIRDVYARRARGEAWGEIGGPADTTEAIERCLAMGVLYCKRMPQLAEAVASNTTLTQNDPIVVSCGVAYCALLGLLVKGAKLDSAVSTTLMDMTQTGELPFHCVTGKNAAPPKVGDPGPTRVGRFPSPDALMSPSFCAAAAADPNIKIEPAWRASVVYGMPCALYSVLPASYYLASRFSNDFEQAVLSAVNGGGQNCARAMLTGALVGAQVGLSGIPSRFIDGLREKDVLVEMAKTLASMIEPDEAEEKK